VPKRLEWIASRVLKEANGENVVVSLARPEKSSAGDWACAFQIEGVVQEVQYAHGLDAFQALIMAITGINSLLANRNRQLTWEGGEPGDSGFPRFVPQAFGFVWAERINRMIDEEIRKFAEQAHKRAETKGSQSPD
jgi:hypothetical protein